MVEEETQPREEPSKRKPLLWGITLALVIAAAVVFLVWLFVWRFEVSTDDAYVHGNQVVVTPQVEGFVETVSVNDTDIVDEGYTLVTLDTVDYDIAYEKAINQLAETVRHVVGLFENVDTLKAKREALFAEMVKTGQDYKHRKKLVELGGVSREDFQHAEAAFASAFSSVIAVEHQLIAAKAQVVGTTVETHPLVEQFKGAVREAYVNLYRCKVLSPVHGMVAKKAVQVGEAVSPAAPLLTIVPLNDIWVDANFKETKLKMVRVGQPVILTSDIYGSDIKFRGKVVGLSAGTGSVMSVLPPQNATGNWIKIVQRLPVRISLNPDEVKNYPLRLGLSMYATIDIRQTDGVMNQAPTTGGPEYKTDIFQDQTKGVEEVIAEVIAKNRLPSSEKSFGSKRPQ